MTSPLEIEAAINLMLQKHLTFSIENKILKQGRLILFCIKDFFCTFTIMCEVKKNKKIVYELPYPFAIEQLDNKLIFDYTTNAFCKNNTNIKNLVQNITSKKVSKLYNKKIIITSV